MVGDLAKAEEHLAALADLCKSSCEEHRELAEKIEAFKKQRGG